MKRVKDYTLLRREIPFEYKDIINDLIWISVCLGNLDQSLTSKDWEGDAFVPVQGMGSSDGEEAGLLGAVLRIRRQA